MNANLHLAMPPRRPWLSGALAVLAVALAVPGAAKDLPPAVDPGLLERRLLPQPSLRERLGAIIVRDTDCRHVAPDDRTVLVLRGTVVESEVHLGMADSASLWEPHLERTMTLAELCALAMRIAASQADAAGAALHAIIPRQRVQDGILHVRIVRSLQDAG